MARWWVPSLIALIFYSVTNAQTCGNVCLEDAADAHEVCWENGSLKNNCHVIRCRNPEQPFRGWSCSHISMQDASRKPSPASAPVQIERGCRNICRHRSSLAWDDCLFKNRTVRGCSVRRYPADGLPHQGWICSPIDTSPLSTTKRWWDNRQLVSQIRIAERLMVYLLIVNLSENSPW